MRDVNIDENSFSDDVAIASTTCYMTRSESDVLRADLASKTILKAAEVGYKIIIVDGGSLDEFLRSFEDSGATILEQKGVGMGASRREAIQAAYDTSRKIIAWTEPEKHHYIQELKKTALPILEGWADIVIPDRGSLDTYPEFQKKAEEIGNRFLACFDRSRAGHVVRHSHFSS